MVWERSQDECNRLVDAFAEMMKNELDDNFFKGDRESWQSWSIDHGVQEVDWHVEKLKFAIEEDDPERIKEHTADVANCVMILLDLFGYIEPAKSQNPPPTAIHNYSNSDHDWIGS